MPEDVRIAEKEMEKIEKYDQIKERRGKIMESKSESNPCCLWCPWNSNTTLEQLQQGNWRQYTDVADTKSVLLGTAIVLRRDLEI